MKTIPITNSRKTGKSSGKIVKGAVASTCGALVIAGLAALFTPSEAQAFSCGRNVYGAGCVSQRGAVAFNRNGAVAVGRYGLSSRIDLLLAQQSAHLPVSRRSITRRQRDVLPAGGSNTGQENDSSDQIGAWAPRTL